MGIFERWGRGVRDAATGPASDPVMPAGGAAASAANADEQAIARYRYMLRTAPPETIEQAHAEAFVQLTPEQRRKVLDSLAADLPDAERAAVARDDASATSLARAATRAEIRNPGALERAFGSVGAGSAAVGGVGLGGVMAGTLLSSLAGTVIGSMFAQHFFAHHPQASERFGQDASSGADRIDDPRAGAPDDGDLGNRHDAGTVADSSDGFGAFDDGGSFDV